MIKKMALSILLLSNSLYIISGNCCSGRTKLQDGIKFQNEIVLHGQEIQRKILAERVNQYGQHIGYQGQQEVLDPNNPMVAQMVEGQVVPENQEIVGRVVNRFEDKPEIKNNAVVNAIGNGLARAARSGRNPFA